MIVGGETAGITTAARLIRAGQQRHRRPRAVEPALLPAAVHRGRRRPRAAERHGALAEFDYDLKPKPSIPFINTMKPRYDMWLLKRYGLPALYWNLMLRGRV